jgi:hypothetical protein
MATQIDDRPAETRYRLTFERIGRTFRGEVREFTARDADDLAEQVWRLARKNLSSRWFEVAADLESMTGTIEAGRFGRFTIEKVPA